jgi:hypothetical protein
MTSFSVVLRMLTPRGLGLLLGLVALVTLATDSDGSLGVEVAFKTACGTEG